MPYIKVDEVVCKGCGLCMHNCPSQAVTMSERINAKGYYIAELSSPEKCIGCTFCAVMCPDIAIRVFRDSPNITPKRKENGL